MKQLKELVMQGKANDTVKRIKELLDKGEKPEVILKEALISAMDEVGDLFQKGEYYVPEMLVSARAMKQGLELLKPALVKQNLKPLGKVAIGTVKGDLHDIGKNLVGIALEGAGFEVIDLGTDVSPEKFVETIKKSGPQVIGLSALLTTTMLSMRDTIEAIKSAGLRNKVKIMVGGAPLRKEFADEIGADFYGPDSTSARNFARDAISKEA